MMHKFHELLREADIHKKTKMVENQTDSHTGKLLVCIFVGLFISIFYQNVGITPTKTKSKLKNFFSKCQKIY